MSPTIFNWLLCIISTITFVKDGLAQQDGNLLPAERACLFHIVQKSPALQYNFGRCFEYSGPAVSFSDGKINYDSIEQIIINHPEYLFIRKSEIGKGPMGLLAEAANKMAVLELNKILLEKRESFIKNKPFENSRYVEFENTLISELPEVALTKNGVKTTPNKELYFFTDPARTFKDKVQYLNQFKTYNEEEKRKIMQAFSISVNKYVKNRCFEIYLQLGGIASDFESHLVAAGEGGSTAGLLSEFEKNLSGKWNKGLPKAIGLFPYQIQAYNIKEISPEQIATIPMTTTGNNRITNLHFDVWGYNARKQTTVVIEKNGKSYILFGAGDTQFLSPDSSFSSGNTLLSVIGELETEEVGKINERISGKKGLDEKIKTRIEKRALVYQQIQKEEGKYLQFKGGKITVKKKAPQKVRRARRKALDGMSENRETQVRPTVKFKKKKRRKKQVDLIDLYKSYEILTKEIFYYQQQKEKENDRLKLSTEKLTYYKSSMGINIQSFTVADSLYTFADSSTFDLRTQEFKFKPSLNVENFIVRLISIPDNSLANSSDEVMLHISKIDIDPHQTATLNIILSDQFDSDKYELKNGLFSPNDSMSLRTIADLLIKSDIPLQFIANGYGIGTLSEGTVTKALVQDEIDGAISTLADSSYAKLRKTAMYVQTDRRVVFEIESFTDPLKSAIDIKNKNLLEFCKKYDLTKNDVLSALRTKSVMIQLQDEFIKWVAKNYEAEKARFIIDRFNNEFQKTKIQIGKTSIKPKELTIY